MLIIYMQISLEYTRKLFSYTKEHSKKKKKKSLMERVITTRRYYINAFPYYLRPSHLQQKCVSIRA